MPIAANQPVWLRRHFLQSAAVLAGASASDASGNFPRGTILDVGGIRVGHDTDPRRPTGCTVALFDQEATAGVDVRGSAPGTRETDLLNPVNTVQQIDAIVLSGGSAFGLESVSGVMRYLREHGRGFRLGGLTVPIVPAAILFDLEVGKSGQTVWPDAEAGYRACQAASATDLPEGNAGAGAGATVGKLFGTAYAMKSGFGTASLKIGGTGVVVGAMVAVNGVGDVRDPTTGRILAGARNAAGDGFRDSIAQIRNGYGVVAQPGAHTTLGVVATNVRFTKVEMTKIAQMSQDGLARVINPVHTPWDGDTIFAVSTGTSEVQAQLGMVGAVAAEVMSAAVIRAVLAAVSIPHYPAARDLRQ
ncbi:MAG: P1 family peptidase [Bryobacteraceae bacterium]